MGQFCESCGAPLTMPDFKGPSDRYCKHCTDTSGNLVSREAVQKGIAMWLKSWQEGITEEQALTRAEYYMKSMPAWTDT